jgi:hypothetical protein
MPDAGAEIRKRGLAFRLTLWILASTTFIFLAAFGYDYLESRALVLKYVEQNAGNLTLATAQQIEKILRGVDAAPRHLASSLEFMHFSRRDLLKQIEAMVKRDRDIFGSTAAFEPYACDPRAFYFAPYYCEVNDQIKLSWLGGKDYRYHEWDWYLRPKKLNRPVWSEPYFDEGGGNIVMSTFSVPFYRNLRGKRTFAGDSKGVIPGQRECSPVLKKREGQPVPLPLAPVFHLICEPLDQVDAEPSHRTLIDTRRDIGIRRGQGIKRNTRVHDIEDKIPPVIAAGNHHIPRFLSRVGVLDDIDENFLQGELQLADSLRVVAKVPGKGRHEVHGWIKRLQPGGPCFLRETSHGSKACLGLFGRFEGFEDGFEARDPENLPHGPPQTGK